MNNLLRTFTDELRNLLNAWLPQLSPDWWKRYVLDALTYQQQERVKQSRIVDLSGLDLAALLRVLDQNWFELSPRFNWPKEGRNWLKEAQTIRNRWAHAPSGDAEPQDAYRDADTIERLAKMLAVGDSALIQIAAYKQQQLARLSPQSGQTPTLSPAVTSTIEPLPVPVSTVAATLSPVAVPPHDFLPGQLVRLKSSRDKIFSILMVLPTFGRLYCCTK